MSTTPYRRTAASARSEGGGLYDDYGSSSSPRVATRPPNVPSPGPNASSSNTFSTPATRAVPLSLYTPPASAFPATGSSGADRRSGVGGGGVPSSALANSGFYSTMDERRRTPLTTREPPGSSDILNATPMRSIPEDAVRQTRPQPVQPPSDTGTQPASAAPAVAAPAPANPPSSIPPSSNAISAPVSTVKPGDSSSEPSLTGVERQNSTSSNNPSLAAQPAATTASTPAALPAQSQKPTLPPLTTAPGAALPQLPYPMFPGAYPFGAPILGPGGRPMMQPYPPFPIPVSIVSYGPGFGVPGAMPPIQPAPAAKPAAPTTAAAATAAPKSQSPGSVPDRALSPPSVVAPTAPHTPVRTAPAPSASSAGDRSPVGVSIDKLRTLASAPTMTEVELAAEKRSERDTTMFLLWLLAALAMVAMMLHIRRWSFDKVLYEPFAAVALALAIVALVLIVLPILAIFIGRTLYERLPTTLLFHALIALLVSFVLYLPILTQYLPHSPDAALLLALEVVEGRFSTSGAIVAALVVHAVALFLCYLTIARVLAGERRLDAGMTGREQEELHTALLAVQAFEDERRTVNQQTLALRRALQAAEDRHTALSSERQRERVVADKRLQTVKEEKDQLTAILDGLDRNKDLDSRQAQLFREQTSHIHANHAAEIRKLVGEADARRTYSLGLEKELALHRDELVAARTRVQAAEAALDSLKLQTAAPELDANRAALLQDELARLTRDHTRQTAELERAEKQLALVDQGACLQCDSTRAKYEQLRDKHMALTKVADENATLRAAVASLKQQLLAAHERTLQLDRRTQKRVRRIEADLEEFDTFTHAHAVNESQK